MNIENILSEKFAELAAIGVVQFYSKNRKPCFIQVVYKTRKAPDKLHRCWKYMLNPSIGTLNATKQVIAH